MPAERRFPQGLVGRVIERPDLWENVARLAADELIAQQREKDLWRLLVEMVRPYLMQARSRTSRIAARPPFWPWKSSASTIYLPQSGTNSTPWPTALGCCTG